MPTEAKQATVAELTSLLGRRTRDRLRPSRPHRWLICARSAASCASKGISYRVVKNRLAQDRGRAGRPPELMPLLIGPSAIALGGSDESALAKGLARRLRPSPGSS